MRFLAFSTFIFILSVFALHGQTSVVISKVEGTSITFVSGGVEQILNPATYILEGRILSKDDTLITDAASTMEIKMGENVVKIAEDTTISIMELDGEGGGVLDVTHGRIRVIAETQQQNSWIWVIGPDMLAGAQKADFGYDIFYNRADPLAERQTVVYSFDGDVETHYIDQEARSKVDLLRNNAIMVASNSMVGYRTTKPGAPTQYEFIDQDIWNYWKGDAGMPVSAPLAPQDTQVSADLNLEEDCKEACKKALFVLGGEISFITGVAMMTAGGLLKAFLPTDEVANGVFIGLISAGGAATITGGGLLIHAHTLP